MARQGRVVILSGPSGAGKTTLHDRLLKDPVFAGRLVRSVSATTRAPRPGERDGREYFFLSEKMFLYKARAGQFLEWMKVYDRFYGTPRRFVFDLLKKGKSVLLCIDVKGARVVKQAVPQALMIFVKTPNLAELKKRLQARKTETPQTLALRLAEAARELKEEPRYDFTIVNDRLDQAYRRLAGELQVRLGMT